MKLNLLPTHVSKASSAKTSMIIGILILVVLVLGAGALYIKANNDLAASREGLDVLAGEAAEAKATADKADVVLANATGIIRNINLAEAMLKHNAAYPNLYAKVLPYIPSFYRITSMSATPLGPGNTQLTLVGSLGSYQQYADLMLALLRIPKATAVSRQGYNLNAPIIPPLNELDQYGKPRKPGDPPVPDNWEDRLQYYQSSAKTTGYLGVSGFGSGVQGVRGPLPNASQVTVQVIIAEDLQTPDPLATLQAGATNAPAPGQTQTTSTTPATPGSDR